MDSFEQQLQDARVMLSTEPNTQKQVLEVILSIFDTALKLWNSKESTKYIDRKISLLNQWNEEHSRPDHSRLALDMIEQELRVLSTAFVMEANK